MNKINSVNMMHHLIKRVIDKNLERYSITYEQGIIICFLVENLNEEITQKKLEEKFQRKSSTISNIVTNLENKGLVKRESDLNDARKKIVKPLANSIELAKELELCINEIERKITGEFSFNENEELDKYFNQILEVLKKELN